MAFAVSISVNMRHVLLAPVPLPENKKFFSGYYKWFNRAFCSICIRVLKLKTLLTPGKKVEKTLEEFQKEKDLQRNRVYTLLSALTEKNIDVLEEISKWEELMPSIQNFREWTKERCHDAQRTYRDELLEPIVDMFVSAFAKSNKAIKDGYDSQIKQYDHQLNG